MDKFKVLPISAKAGNNIDTLIDIIFEFLPEGPALYEQDIISDMPRKLVISEIIREKLFQTLHQELPHSVSVMVEHMQPVRKSTMLIKAMILVERQTQKEIVIGKGGAALKKIGTMAREDLEELLGQKVFLELFVKVDKNWRNDPTRLQELGYDFMV
jgi:GTP-binding protein Era